MPMKLPGVERTPTTALSSSSAIRGHRRVAVRLGAFEVGEGDRAEGQRVPVERDGVADPRLLAELPRQPADRLGRNVA